MDDGFSPEGLIGRRLGEFVLREPMGQGSFGLVFRAEQTVLQREAVLKIAKFDGDRAVATFLREARLASRIDHPFAAHVYSFGAEPDGLLWIAMELIRGTPLDQLLRTQGALPMERAIPLLARLSEVVHAVHEHGIVHRDIKPANLMLVSRGGSMFVKLLDLGIARDVADRESPRAPGVTGTPFYMAPEQWLKPELAGPAADIYSLGVLAFELLTGAPPFHGGTLLEIARCHAVQPPPSLGPLFPEALSRAIARAMAKREDERFATALLFGAALQESSGISSDAFNLPSLDEITRDEVLMHAPQPLAEAVAAFEAARSPGPALTALWHATYIAAKYVALVALSCRKRVGSGRIGDVPAVGELLAALTRRSLDAAQWWRLGKELCRPFATIAEAHPMPELVALYFEGKAELRTPMDGLLDSVPRQPNRRPAAETLRSFLVGAVPALGAVLRSLRFLHGYRLVVPHAGRDEVWMGVRRQSRSTLTVIRAAAVASSSAPAHLVPSDRPILVGTDGVVVASVWPAIQVASPASGAAPELFLLDGRGRNGARLVDAGGKLEHSDAELWRQLGLDATDSHGPQSRGADDASPYRGLSTFTESDAELFFGREREVERFVNRLRVIPWIAVVGPSGAGKSSFVRAGILPALARPPGESAELDQGRWKALVTRPGASPLAHLCARLVEAGIAISPEQIVADPAALGQVLRSDAASQGGSVLLVIDQLEELFTLCFDAAEQETYASALVLAARDVEDPLRLVVTLRDDFLVRAAQLAPFRDRLAASLEILTTPLESDLLRILREPARQVGYEFEDAALPEEMVAQVAQQPAALALLSFTAFQLWQFRDRQFKQLPRKAYRALGGVGGALAQHAEATLDALDDRERKLAREVFRHLVTADGTRAVMSREELLQVTGEGGSELAPAVLERLIQARLLVAMEAPSGENIELVHEALLSAWPRLVRWRQEDAEGARLRDQLRAAAKQWHERGRSRGLLWRGEALVEYQLWRSRYAGSLTLIEEAFGGASVLDARRGRRLRRGALAAVFAGLAVALIVFARLRVVADGSRVRAEASESRAADQLTASYVEQGRRALLSADTSSALLYLNEAFQRGLDTAGLRFMIARGLQALGEGTVTLRAHSAAAYDVAYSHDGSRLATIGADGSAKLWDVASGRLLATMPGHDRLGMPVVAWTMDDTRVITGDYTGAIRVWTTEGAMERQLLGHHLAINQLTVGRDGTSLVSASDEGAVKLWDLATGVARTLAAPTDETVLAAGVPELMPATGAWLSPDERQVAVVYGFQARPGRVVIWTPVNDRKLTLDGHTAPILSVAFDPSGRWLATASRDRTARIWNTTTGAVRHILQGHDDVVTDIAWSPDGSTLATAGADGMIKLWDPETGAIRFGLRGHTGRINRIIYSKSGELLVSASVDGTARVWSASRGALVATYLHGGVVQTVALRGDQQLATAGWDGNVKLWPLARRDLERTMFGEPTLDPLYPEDVPIVTHDRRRAVGAGMRGGELWNLEDGTLVQLSFGSAGAHPSVARSGDTIAIGDRTGAVHVFHRDGRELQTIRVGQLEAAYELSPAGDRLATAAGDDEAIAIWDVASATKLAERKLGSLYRFLWSPSGQVLIVMSYDEAHISIHSLDPGTLATRAVLHHDANLAEFAPDGETLAIGGLGPVVELWNVSANGASRRLQLEHAGSPECIAWTPQGQLLVGQIDGSLQIWSGSGASLAHIAAHGLWVAAVTASSDGSRAVTTSLEGFAKVWDLQTFQELYAYRVAPQTRFASFVLNDTKLLSMDGSHQDLWTADSYAGTPQALAARLRCLLLLELDNGTPRARSPECP